MKNNKLGDEEWKGMNKIYKLGSSEKGIIVFSNPSGSLDEFFIFFGDGSGGKVYELCAHDALIGLSTVSMIPGDLRVAGRFSSLNFLEAGHYG